MKNQGLDIAPPPRKPGAAATTGTKQPIPSKPKASKKPAKPKAEKSRAVSFDNGELASRISVRPCVVSGWDGQVGGRNARYLLLTPR